MASNEDLAPSSLDLLHPPPPSPPSSSLSFQTHSTTSFSTPSRPISIEIYNHILHFAFGRHLPPIPLEDRLDEPPSLAPLLPLTLVSKGLRELVLPLLYYHITIRREEDWIQLFDPEEGLLAGEGEEATRRAGWVRKLSFARDGFPISSWTPSKDHPGEWETRSPEPNMAPLDFLGLGDLEEVCIGNWEREDVEEEVEAAVDVEMRGGPYRDQTAEGWYGSTEQELRDRIEANLVILRSIAQSTSVLDLLSQTHPVRVHASLSPFHQANRPSPDRISTSFIFHPPGYAYAGEDEEADELSLHFGITISSLPPLRFNLDLVLERLLERGRKSLIRRVSGQGWTKDEAGWWTRD